MQNYIFGLKVKKDSNLAVAARSCKRSDTLFQKSLLLLLTWREYFSTVSQLTYPASQKSKDLIKVPALLPWSIK